MSREDQYEAHLHEQLAMLRRAYEEAAKPIIKELVRIRNMRPPSPIFIDLMALPPEQRAFIEEHIK